MFCAAYLYASEGPVTAKLRHIALFQAGSGFEHLFHARYVLCLILPLMLLHGARRGGAGSGG